MKKWILLFVISGILGMRDNAIANDSLLLKAGTYVLGANYWASHAGTNMWKDWRPEVVEKDFEQLSKNGVKVLRVFPLWPDFQPVQNIYTGAGEIKYIADKNEQPLPPGGDGMDEQQLKNFETLTKIASRYNIKVVVALITGWMSGRLYVPPALEGKNILTDAGSLYWQRKFVSSFVSRFKNNSAILAWDFGNECNVMQRIGNHYEANTWMAVLSGAIRSQDRSRPIISGMHGLKAENNEPWRIIDQTDYVEVVTTHPYSLFTPYAGIEAINTIRPLLHGTAETRFYADLSGRPGLVEEIGVLGQMVAGENEEAAFARTVLFSHWAHDCKGTMWWCAYDQTKLNHPPYNYSQVESNLGLIKEDRTEKPVMKEFAKFSEFQKNLPFKYLPEFNKQAICLLTEGQDNWGIAYSSFILAKQSGFDISFQKIDQDLKDANLYLLPSLNGFSPFTKNDWDRLLRKVKNGATLYVSLDNVHLTNFIDPMGVEVLTNSIRKGWLSFHSDVVGEGIKFNSDASQKLRINPVSASVIAKEEDGNPVMLMNKYGEGTIYLLTFPIEKNFLSANPVSENASPFHLVYKYIADSFLKQRSVSQSNISIGVTEHDLSKNEKVVVLINYSPNIEKANITFQNGWKIKNILYGNDVKDNELIINANDAVVITLRKS